MPQLGQNFNSNNHPPGVSFPYRLGENDQCISVIELERITSMFNAPLKDGSTTKCEVWPTVTVANLRKPVLGNLLSIPIHDQSSVHPPTAP
jgi:hypothetical protein